MVEWVHTQTKGNKMFTCPKCGEKHKSFYNAMTHEKNCKKEGK